MNETVYYETVTIYNNYTTHQYSEYEGTKYVQGDTLLTSIKRIGDQQPFPAIASSNHTISSSNRSLESNPTTEHTNQYQPAETSPVQPSLQTSSQRLLYTWDACSPLSSSLSTKLYTWYINSPQNIICYSRCCVQGTKICTRCYDPLHVPLYGIERCKGQSFWNDPTIVHKYKTNFFVP